MADDSEIDLYDNADDNWKRESLDLYDDVESHSNSDNQKESKPISQSNYIGRRIATYVGNLRWWTTDQDIFGALSKLDISDVLEVRFHENRQNGQSKGFCVVVFGSDKSTKEAMEKLPKSEIHGLAPIVTFCNKQNLNYFEQAAGGGTSGGSTSNSTNNINNNNNNNNNGNKMKTDMTRNNGPSSIMSNNNINNSNSQMQIGSLCNNNMRFPGNMVGISGMAGLSQNLLFNLSQQYTQNSMNRGPNMMMQNTISTPLNVSAGHMNMSMTAQRLMQPNAMMMQPNMSMQMGGPTPHLNPNFFNAAQASGMLGNMTGGVMNHHNQQHHNNFGGVLSSGSTGISGTMNIHPYDAFGRPITNSFSTMSDVSLKLSENEFDEILQRNKTVSSSAINRAVQDASAGDYASAIETLVTAISLIKQSKIAADNRCKVLINSLQDTLTGIESKSYGSRKIRNQRRRSFSDSSSDPGDRDEDYGGSRRVLRSRSRDRHHRSRDYGTGTHSTNQHQSSSTTTPTIASTGTDYPSDRYVSRYRH